MIVEEASQIGLPPGLWPSDIKCLGCKGNASRKYFQRPDNSSELEAVVYQCTSCEEEIYILND